MKAKVYDLKGNPVKEISLSDNIFGVEYNNDLVYQALVIELANQRQGTASTKTRGEVSGGGKKPWRQKGTGRARHGSIRSPIWVGGGIAHGPKPRDYSTSLPKKMKRKALFAILSEKLRSEDLKIIQDFSLDTIKTKIFVEKFSTLLSSIESGHGLLILPENDKNIILSARNLPKVELALYNNLSVRTVFYPSKIFITESAVKKLEDLYSKTLVKT